MDSTRPQDPWRYPGAAILDASLGTATPVLRVSRAVMKIPSPFLPSVEGDSLDPVALLSRRVNGCVTTQLRPRLSCNKSHEGFECKRSVAPFPRLRRVLCCGHLWHCLHLPDKPRVPGRATPDISGPAGHRSFPSTAREPRCEFSLSLPVLGFAYRARRTKHGEKVAE